MSIENIKQWADQNQAGEQWTADKANEVKELAIQLSGKALLYRGLLFSGENLNDDKYKESGIWNNWSGANTILGVARGGAFILEVSGSDEGQIIQREIHHDGDVYYRTGLKNSPTSYQFTNWKKVSTTDTTPVVHTGSGFPANHFAKTGDIYCKEDGRVWIKMYYQNTGGQWKEV